MSWTTAILDLRNFLEDTDDFKLKYRKRCFDQSNGTNKRFKTFEHRRVTDLSNCTDPLGVYVDGVRATVALDFPLIGEFELSSAPLDGQVVECTYYGHWFLDSELTTILNMAAMNLGFTDYTTIVDGLKPAALKFAISDACQKLANRYSFHFAEMYRLEDSQDPKFTGVSESFSRKSSEALKEAQKLVENFYSLRQGRGLQPLFRSISGRVSDPTPKR